jgi:hypothetical protein
VATDDLHAPLGLETPAARRPIAHSVAAAVLGIATAAVVIGATVWYEPLNRSLPTPTPPQAAAAAATKPEPAVTTPASPRVVSGTALPPQARPQVTGSIQPSGGLDAAPSQDNPLPGPADRVITIIDGRSGARQEVRIPASSDTAKAPDPGLADLTHTIPSVDETPEPPPQPPRAKPSVPQKRAKPGPTLSTNSASQAPLR